MVTSPWRRAGHGTDDEGHRYQHHGASELGEVAEDTGGTSGWRVGGETGRAEVEVGEAEMVAYHQKDQPESGGADDDHGRGGGEGQPGEGGRIEPG